MLPFFNHVVLQWNRCPTVCCIYQTCMKKCTRYMYNACTVVIQWKTNCEINVFVAFGSHGTHIGHVYVGFSILVFCFFSSTWIVWTKVVVVFVVVAASVIFMWCVQHKVYIYNLCMVMQVLWECNSHLKQEENWKIIPLLVFQIENSFHKFKSNPQCRTPNQKELSSCVRKTSRLPSA